MEQLWWNGNGGTVVVEQYLWNSSVEQLGWNRNGATKMVNQ